MQCPIFFSNLFLVEQSNIEAGQGGRISRLSRCSPLLLLPPWPGKGPGSSSSAGVFRRMPTDTSMAAFSVCSMSHLCSNTQRLHGMPAEQVIRCSEGPPSKDRMSPASQGCISHAPRPLQRQDGPTGCSAPAQGWGTDASHMPKPCTRQVCISVPS